METLDCWLLADLSGVKTKMYSRRLEKLEHFELSQHNHQNVVQVLETLDHLELSQHNFVRELASIKALLLTLVGPEAVQQARHITHYAVLVIRTPMRPHVVCACT